MWAADPLLLDIAYDYERGEVSLSSFSILQELSGVWVTNSRFEASILWILSRKEFYTEDEDTKLIVQHI